MKNFLGKLIQTTSILKRSDFKLHAWEKFIIFKSLGNAGISRLTLYSDGISVDLSNAL